MAYLEFPYDPATPNLVGALSGDKCEAWTKKLEQEKAVADLRAKAEAGDATAMTKIGAWYRYAYNGLAEDASLAFYWFKRAADLRRRLGRVVRARDQLYDALASM